MAEPKIDPDWHNDHNMGLRPFLVIGIPVFIIVVAVVLSFFKGCTALGEQGCKDSFNPAECSDEGFVGGTNRLLAELLKDTVEGNNPVYDLESLNKKYRALEFALPYGEGSTPIISASDLRLVGIHAERIKSKEDRMFYYNSRLPQILQRQKMEMAETFFRIKCKAASYNDAVKSRPILIEQIELIPSLFKVALSKDPWTGIIECSENSLFDDSVTIYVSYGNSVLPLRKVKNPAAMSNPMGYRAVANLGRFLTKDGKEVDFYRHFKEMFDPDNSSRKESLQIFMYETADKSCNVDFNVSCLGDKLEIVSRVSKIRVYNSKGVTDVHKELSGAKDNFEVELEDGLKLIAYNESDQKLGEFTVYTSNPLRKLSCLVQTSLGKRRYNIPSLQTDLFTQQVVRGLSRNLANSYNIDTVSVTLDPLLSLELERELKAYVKSLKSTLRPPKCQKDEVYDISMTVMDLETGDIIASPFYTTQFDSKDYPDALKMTTRNPALIRRYLGSTFKPLLALAAVQTYNGLIDLNTVGKYSREGNNATFFGKRTGAWAKNTSHWGGIDFQGFISRSDDVYPVALAAFAMSGERSRDGFKTLPVDGDMNFFTYRGGRLQMRKYGDTHFTEREHPFTRWITHLYNANYSDEITTDTVLFQNLYKIREADMEDKHFGLEEISPDVTNLNTDRFLQGGEFNHILVPWVLGQGDNQWNCFKIAEAWSRMVGKREVNMSLLKTEQMPGSLADNSRLSKLSVIDKQTVSPANVNAVWNKFLAKFNAAQNGGTLKGMNDAVARLNPAIGRDLLLFSKTGTPEAYTRYEVPMLGGSNRQIDIGMYTFALVDRSQYNRICGNEPKAGKGIVCVLRITRTYTCDACNKKHGVCKTCEGSSKSTNASLWSSHATRFFTNNPCNPNILRKFYDMTRRYY